MKALREMHIQFEALVRDLSEEEYLDNDVEALFVALLTEAEALLKLKRKGTK